MGVPAQSTTGSAAIRWLTKMLHVVITDDCVAFMRYGYATISSEYRANNVFATGRDDERVFRVDIGVGIGAALATLLALVMLFRRRRGLTDRRGGWGIRCSAVMAVVAVVVVWPRPRLALRLRLRLLRVFIVRIFFGRKKRLKKY